MGFKFNDVCFPTQDEARMSACSTFKASVMQTTNLYTSECTSTVFTTANMTVCKRTNGGACNIVNQPWPITPACTHDGGVSLSYDYFLAAITFLCIVWGGKKLIQLFDNHHAES